MSVTPDGDATVTVVVRLLGSATRRDLAVLDAHERERARRFVFDVDRDRYVAAHAWTRRMLAARTDVRPGDITVVRDERGKPGVPGGPSFSLSHDDDLAALAVGPPGMAIGVDVARIPREVDVQAAALVLGPAELAAATATDGTGSGPGAFATAWTRKEAWVKATGEGLHDGLRTVDLLHDRTPDGLWVRTFARLGRRRRRPDVVVSLVAGMPLDAAVIESPDLEASR